MTALEFDKMTKAMRRCGHELKTRADAEEPAYMLYRGLQAIGRTELADELWELYNEMESMDSAEIIKCGTFR